MADRMTTAEQRRLQEDADRQRYWKRWGPYLSERQWGTVREDYSEQGTCWDYLPHDHARSRAYRWGEDGLLGITDTQCRLCFSLALWNGQDPILKERLYGLTGPQGNHGEDVKECYHYLDSTPTHSYMKGLYRYPQAAFPYERLVRENGRRGKTEPEFELSDTGVFDDGRYFDVMVEYAKADAEDVLIRITVTNRGPDEAPLHLLPTIWFRNVWSWGRRHESTSGQPHLAAHGPAAIEAVHDTLGNYRLHCEPRTGGPQALFTDNVSNTRRLFGHTDGPTYAKDAFHDRVVDGHADAVRSDGMGTKAAFHHQLLIPAGEAIAVRCRLQAAHVPAAEPFDDSFDTTFARRQEEADAFFAARTPPGLSTAQQTVARQSYAGLLWTKQFYHYVVDDWLAGDPAQPTPSEQRLHGRNHDWGHLHARDVLSMPDKWEYPWFAAWDLAFHMIPFAHIDPAFAKKQLLLLLREWYQHPNGALPAYEFALGDVNPPVHAWACWRVYKLTGEQGQRDRVFLARVFHKLLLNFTWWVNRKDNEGNNIFGGGFLGLDNIGVFDRSKPLPVAGTLDQADGTAWMAFYCGTMLSMALELARHDPAYEDIAFKFLRHFIDIAEACNSLGGSGLWDETDGFYYDHLRMDGTTRPLRIRSLVGLIPLIAVENLATADIEALPDFKRRVDWFLEHRPELTGSMAYMETHPGHGKRLLAIPSRERLQRMLGYLFDEDEFLSPYGIRSLSKVHQEQPFQFDADGQQWQVAYTPGESDTFLFGGNSNWRGPIWFPLNFLVVEALERYHHFYGDDLKVECPTGSGHWMNLSDAADEITRRLLSLFEAGADGRRPYDAPGDPVAGGEAPPHLFYEYFHADTGRGLGASHQTGWTALAASFLEKLQSSE